MIQRIQSFYLFLSGLIVALLLLFFDFETGTFPLIEKLGIASKYLFSAAIILCWGTMLLFKKRSIQLKVNWVHLLFLLCMAVDLSVKLFGENNFSVKNIVLLSSIISMMLLIVFANRGINKDEALVKSTDSIR